VLQLSRGIKDKPSLRTQLIFSFRGIGYVFWIH